MDHMEPYGVMMGYGIHNQHYDTWVLSDNLRGLSPQSNCPHLRRESDDQPSILRYPSSNKHRLTSNLQTDMGMGQYL
jgi:hypothetical protein